MEKSKLMSFKQYTIVLFVAITSLSFRTGTTLKKGNLIVVISNIKSVTGQIGIYIFNSNNDFPDHFEKATLSTFVKVSGNTVEYTFTNVEIGTYAIALFHDENNDKKLNSNFIGMPKEGLGFSNNAKGNLGAPKYDDAKFDFIKPEQTINISVKYL